MRATENIFWRRSTLRRIRAKRAYQEQPFLWDDGNTWIQIKSLSLEIGHYIFFLLVNLVATTKHPCLLFSQESSSWVSSLPKYYSPMDITVDLGQQAEIVLLLMKLLIKERKMENRTVLIGSTLCLSCCLKPVGLQIKASTPAMGDVLHGWALDQSFKPGHGRCSTWLGFRSKFQPWPQKMSYLVGLQIRASSLAMGDVLPGNLQILVPAISPQFCKRRSGMLGKALVLVYNMTNTNPLQKLRKKR